MDDLKLSTIPFEALGPYWADVEPIMQRAIDVAGEYDIDTVLKGLAARDFQLWALFDGEQIKSAAITTITVYPRKKVCTVIAGAGAGLAKWKEAFKKIDQWRLEQGCDTFRVVGRKGWARELKDMKIMSVILEK